MIAVEPPIGVLARKRIPKRLPERKAVTIGIGFKCKDGVVLCADQQITWSGGHKYYENKIYPLQTDEYTVAFTFAGNPNLMKSFKGKFDAAMKLFPPPYTGERIQDAIETVLGLMDALDTDPDGLHMVCSVVIPGQEIRLIKTARKVVSQVSDYVAYDYVGVGDSSLLRYLADLLTNRSNGEFMERHACMLGTFLVCRAKAFVDGCGGDTDILVLHKQGMLEPRSNQAYAIEQRLLRIESHVRQTASKFFDRRITGEEFTNQLKYLVSALTQDHLEMQVSPLTKYEKEP